MIGINVRSIGLLRLHFYHPLLLIIIRCHTRHNIIIHGNTFKFTLSSTGGRFEKSTSIRKWEQHQHGFNENFRKIKKQDDDDAHREGLKVSFNESDSKVPKRIAATLNVDLLQAKRGKEFSSSRSSSSSSESLGKQMFWVSRPS